MDTNPHLAGTARLVADAMREREVSQKSLAEATGIPRVTLRRRLDGHTSFTIAELAAIAAVLEVKVSDLLPAEIPA